MDVLDIFGFLGGELVKWNDIYGVFFVEISDELSGERCFFLSYFNLFNVLPSWISLKSYTYMHNIIDCRTAIVDWGVCLMFSISLFMHYHHARNKRWLARSSWIFSKFPDAPMDGMFTYHSLTFTIKFTVGQICRYLNCPYMELYGRPVTSCQFLTKKSSLSTRDVKKQPTYINICGAGLNTTYNLTKLLLNYDKQTTKRLKKLDKHG